MVDLARMSLHPISKQKIGEHGHGGRKRGSYQLVPT